MLQDAERAALIWQRLKAFVPPTLPPLAAGGPELRPVGCLPNLRLYRYDQGQVFGPHGECDSAEAAPPPLAPDGRLS